MRLIPFILTLALASTATATDPAPRIHNTAQAPGGVEIWNFGEDWSAGGEDDDIFFGVISDAKTDTDGNILLLDLQLSEIHVYSPEGEHLRILGREGEGPGEFRRAQRLVMLPGERVGAVMGFPGKIVTLEKDGTPAPSIIPGDATAGGFRVIFGAGCSGDNIVACGARMAQSDEGMIETRFLSIFGMDGAEILCLMSKERLRDFSKPSYIESQEYFVMGRWTVGPDGRIYAAAERDAYIINVYAPDGTLEYVIEKDYKSRKRTQEEKDDVGSDMRIVVDGNRLQMKREVLDNDPCITSLFVDTDGLLWVADSHSEVHDGVFRRYDVFDTVGRFVKQVDIVIDADPDKDGFFALGDGRFVLVRGLVSASDAMNSDFDDGHGDRDNGDDDLDTLDDAEPLEVVLLRRAA